jgi:hypothetical protein
LSQRLFRPLDTQAAGRREAELATLRHEQALERVKQHQADLELAQLRTTSCASLITYFT